MDLVKTLITHRFQHNKMRALRQYSLRKTQVRSKRPTNSLGKNSSGLEALLSLKTPIMASQQITPIKKKFEDIKQEIHKLRTESPQLSLNPSPNSLESDSFFLSYPRSKKGE